MNDNPKYVMYRNKRIPRWWKDYLPDEKNPYKKEDTLTLEVGCLSDYWHIHSSNKHPNYKGADACNAIQEMVYYLFGGAFLSGGGGYGGHQGQKRKCQKRNGKKAKSLRQKKRSGMKPI